MISLTLKDIFISSIAVFLLLKNPLRADSQNVSQLNESDFSLISSVNLTSNFTDYIKFKSQTNGRMRSFFGEEEKEEITSQQIFEGMKSQKIVDSSKNLSENNFENKYFYPIFNYQIDSHFINDSQIGKNSTNSSITSSRMNMHKLNKNGVNKLKGPRYRFKKKIQTNLSILSPFLENLKTYETENNSSNIIKLNKIEDKNENINEFETNITKLSENLKNSGKNISLIDIIPQKSAENESILSLNWLEYSYQNNKTDRFCVSTSDCDIKLNERCINQKKYSICGCAQPFFRENYSNECQMKKLIRLLFKVSLNYSNNINNNNSFELIQMKYLIERNIWLVIMNSSNLLSIVDNIKVFDLIDSKLVVDFYVKIANPSNNFHHKYIEYNFWYRLMSIIRGINFKSNENEFNWFDMRAIEIVNDIDYCSVKEINYCSDSAICVDDNDSEFKFKCKCKSGLTDISPNVNFRGEICTLKCNLDFCGTGGLCQIRNDTEIQCICTNWNFGERCQYSFNTFLCVSALFIIFSIFFSFCLASLYCGYKIHEEFNKLKNLIIKNNSNVDNSLPLI